MNSARILAVLLTLCLASIDAYSKYGRTCRDIGCRSDEVCVMAEDPCNYNQRDQCGRYPTCERKSGSGESCRTKYCPSGMYCKTEDGKPTCVNTVPSLGYDSAGISAVNGQPTSINNQHANPADEIGSRYAGQNPYANANAPPLDDHSAQNQPPYPSSQGYPPYPVNSNGYPPYPPVSGQQPGRNSDSLGYPPYPTQNRNPASGYPPYPNYPPQHNPVPPGYPPQHYPGYNNPYGGNRPGSQYSSNYGGYRRNGGSSITSNALVAILGLIFAKILASIQAVTL